MGVCYSFEGYEVADGRLTYAGQTVPVEPLVGSFIALMATHSGSVVTHDEVRTQLWSDHPPADSTLYSIVSKARQALSRCSRNPITAVRGSGYKFIARVESRRLAAQPEIFVGRTEELAELQRIWARVERRSEPGLALVTGAPGAGKTALVRHFCRQLSVRPVRCLWGRCLASVEAPAFWPWEGFWAEVAPALLDHQLEHPDSAPLASTSGDGWKQLRHPVLNVSELRRERMLTLANCLQQASVRERLVLVFDDVHLAGEEAIRLLDFVSSSSMTGRVLFVATLRSPESGSDRHSQLRRHGSALPLGPLGPRHSLKLLRELVADCLEAPYEQRILDRAEGNPLFIEELAHLARRVGPQQLEHAALPERVSDAIDRHLAALPDTTMTVLRVAALMGELFDVEPIANALGTVSSQLVETLQFAVRANVARQTSARQFEFAHAMHQQRLLEVQALEDRRAVHLRLAQALVALGRIDGASLGSIARHWQLGAGSPRELHQAAEASRRAGESYAERHAHEAAAEHFRTALELAVQVGWSAKARIYIALRLSDCLWNLGKRSEAQPIVDKAIELGRNSEDGVALGLAVLALARLHVDLVVAPRLEHLLSEALTLLPDCELSLRAQLEACRIEQLRDGPERVGAIERALELATASGDAEAKARVATARVYAHWGSLDSLPLLPEFIDEALSAARVAANDQLLRTLQNFRLLGELELGNLARVRLLEHELARAELNTPSSFQQYLTQVRQAALAAFTGNPSALQLAAQAFELGQSVVPEIATDLYFGQRLLLAWETGNASRVSQEAIGLAGSYVPTPATFVIAAFSCAMVGDRSTARAAYLTARDIAPDGMPVDRLQSCVSYMYAELHAWFGDTAAAQRAYDQLCPLGTRLLVTGMVATIPGISSYSLGRVAHFLGDTAAALDHFRAARELAERFGSTRWMRRCGTAAELASRPYAVDGPLRP